VLWHTDLHGTNIMIKQKGTLDIVGIIDLQGMNVAPLFMQSVFAKFARYTGDNRIVIPPGTQLPSCPPDFERYKEDKQSYIKDQLHLAMFHKHYEISIIYNSPYQYAVHEYPHMEHILPLLSSASRTWYEGAHHLLQCIIEMQESWNDIAPGMAFPLLLHQRDIGHHYEEYARLKAYNDQVSHLMNDLKIEGDGWVSNERYKEISIKCDELRREWNIDCNGGLFPFQDGIAILE
jgi:hypothetical protein